MNINGNTILITGGSSGIGRGLAEAFHRQGNQVVIAGRRAEALDAVTALNPGMRSMTLDVESPEDIRAFGERIAREVPELDVLINNAGIQRVENLKHAGADFSAMDSTIAINLLGPMRLTSVLLPQLLRRPRAAVLNVTSTLAFLPMSAVPSYCATKAAMHSWTQSLRYQLKASPVEVIEVIPPYVQTSLGPSHGSDPRAMPLQDFIGEVMTLLGTQPGLREIVVERAKAQRFAVERGGFDAGVALLNPPTGPLAG
jgi:uncharacterized oxidoreductase